MMIRFCELVTSKWFKLALQPGCGHVWFALFAYSMIQDCPKGVCGLIVAFGHLYKACSEVEFGLISSQQIAQLVVITLHLLKRDSPFVQLDY